MYTRNRPDVNETSAPFPSPTNAEILHHGPPPAYARGQAAVGGVPRLAAGAPPPAFWGGRCASDRVGL